MSKKISILFSSLIIALFFSTSNGFAAGGHAGKIEKQHWSFSGIFGKWEQDSLQRGFQVYSEVCSACHSLKYVAYGDLVALGYSEAQIKTVAGEVSVTDGPNDEGEYYERPAAPSDKFVSPFANEQAARYANNGAYPLDLSLVAKSFPAGPDYIYAVLNGYHDAPAGVDVPEGLFWNDGKNATIAMLPPLVEGLIEYQDGREASVENMAYDVSNFLMWAAEPHLQTRKEIGFRVMLFLIFFTIVLYANKRKLWRKVH